MTDTSVHEPGLGELITSNALYADHVTIRFGGLVAVNDVSFSIPPESIVSLIGPNGAGKTTFFNVITGLYRPTDGQVFFDGADITVTKPHLRAAAGLARTFQNIRLFNLMTAEENVLVAMHSRLKSGMVSTILRTPWQRREEREARERAHDLLRFVGIGKVAGETARNLSYGDQRRLEVARALALEPRVLLLDEPTAGMNPQESSAFNDFVHRVRDEKGVAILLIEHDMSVVMRVSERITVLDRGEKIAEGTPDEIRTNPRVIEAYLGKSGTERGSREARPSTDTRDRKAIAAVAAEHLRRQRCGRVRGGDPMLKLKKLSVSYGNIAAVQGLEIEVYPGEIVTLIGANGAGKSTTLRTISGLLRPRAGEVVFEGRRISGLPGHEVVKAGICHSPEGRRIFARMSVAENLDLGAFLRKDTAQIAEDRETVLMLFPVLRERLQQKAGTLSGGEQQMLAVGRALLGNPRLLLLDEPSMGLAPVLVDVIFETIEKIREQGVTVLLVEQNALAALRIADYGYVLESGHLTLQGPAAELLKDESLTKAYLGG